MEALRYCEESIYYVGKGTRVLLITEQEDGSWNVKGVYWDGRNENAPFVIVPKDELDKLNGMLINMKYTQSWQYENIRCFKRAGGFD